MANSFSKIKILANKAQSNTFATPLLMEQKMKVLANLKILQELENQKNKIIDEIQTLNNSNFDNKISEIAELIKQYERLLDLENSVNKGF